jgi:hypothetical protein
MQIWASEHTKALNPNFFKMGSQAISNVQCENGAFSQAGFKQGARASHWTERKSVNTRDSRRPLWGSVREGLKLGKILEKEKNLEGTSGPRESIRVS